MNAQADAVRAFVARSGGERPREHTGALVVASGKGGEGTSTVAALLARAVSRRAPALAIDACPGVGSLHLLLGLDDQRAGAGLLGLRRGGGAPAELVVPAAVDLAVLPGGLDAEAFEVPASESRALLRRLLPLHDDYAAVVMDAGSRMEAVDGALRSGGGRIVAVTTGTAIGAAATYALLKAVEQRHPGVRIDVVVNRRDRDEAELVFDALATAARQFLGRRVEWAGHIPDVPLLGGGASAPALPPAGELSAVDSAVERVLDRLFQVKGHLRQA